MPLRPAIRARGLLPGHIAAATALGGQHQTDRPRPLLPDGFAEPILGCVYERLFCRCADRLQLRGGVHALAHGLARHLEALRRSGHVAARLLEGLSDGLIR